MTLRTSSRVFQPCLVVLSVVYVLLSRRWRIQLLQPVKQRRVVGKMIEKIQRTVGRLKIVWENAMEISREAEVEFRLLFWSGSDHGMRKSRPVEEVVLECCYHLDAAWWAIDVRMGRLLAFL